jgi:SAM-dependent methyltransferase
MIATKDHDLAREYPGAVFDAERFWEQKYGDLSKAGWRVQMRHRFGYMSCDDYYEMLVEKRVTQTTRWLDVGCGRHLFPNNPGLSRQLAGRCRRLVGVDPDETLADNPYVHERVQESIFSYRTGEQFDLITLRMVAEHISEPKRLLEVLKQVTAPGGRVILYTVFKWSPVPLVTRFTPFRLHHAVKRTLWGTEERDTFPVQNRMNTRRALDSVFGAAGFEERHFFYLPDVTVLSRWPSLFFGELSLWRVMRQYGLRYPELCLLGEYERLHEGQPTPGMHNERSKSSDLAGRE